MGANSQRRRRARQRQGARPFEGPSPFTADPDDDGSGVYEVVERAALSTIYRIGGSNIGPHEMRAVVESLRRSVRPHAPHVLETVLSVLLDRLTRETLASGWGRADLSELVRRCASAAALDLMAAVLDGERHLRLASVEAQASALQLAALLMRAPRVAASDLIGTATSDDSGAHPKLAQVRALLAKAESTEYDEEAEALSTKAQELISKYALEHLVEDHRDGLPGDLAMRRLWLDPPYVDAKATLVHQVALANRTRSASTSALGFCLLVGAPLDLDAVELLVTSLLVQADAAMLRHGRRVDGVGRSRTRSFRRSFLLAYAGRIGQRLRVAAESVAADREDRLPVLRDHEERVAKAFAEAMPDTVTKGVTYSNREGWAAGVVAADLAHLDVHGKLDERAG